MNTLSKIFLALPLFALALPLANAEVKISDATDEGLDAFKIETANATYFYQKEAGGFSSILDQDGIDWVQFRVEKGVGYPAGAASEYRGLPNLVYKSDDSGAGHPGFDKCASSLVDGQTIRTLSKSGKWQWSWKFTDTDAVMTVEKVDPAHYYWFLYEGPIAGKFDPKTQYWGHDEEGPIDSFNDYFTSGGKIDRYDWAYFGSRTMNRIFFVQQLTPDRVTDLMGYLGNTNKALNAPDGMVVFGFGRQKDAVPLLSKPNRFRIGFINTAIKSKADHENLVRKMEGGTTAPKPLAFSMRQVNSGLKNFWAHMPADVTNDGIADWVFHTNNAYGGGLAYFKGQTARGDWELVTIAEKGPNGAELATGDMELADMDGDGDADPIVVQHTGEWENSAEASKLFWYENPTWDIHEIGDAPAFVKDVNLKDLNDDGRVDVAVLTFEKESLSIFRQNTDGSFTETAQLIYPGLHEGMDAGDLNGDGLPDIATCGYIFYNPGGDLTGEWTVHNLDPKWNTQTGDWSRNATKVAIKDLDGDGSNDVIMSHSERAGYPLCWYTKNEAGDWEERIIREALPAAHTLEVYDMDLDGDLDIVTGINWGRAVNLEINRGDLLVILNNGEAESWTDLKLSDDGIYNGRVIDYDGDGDLDIFRLPHHGAEEGYVLENQIR